MVDKGTEFEDIYRNLFISSGNLFVRASTGLQFDFFILGKLPMKKAVEKSKPAPDIFLKACEVLNELPESTYAIEDSYNGIRAVYAGGLCPIMVPDLLPPDGEMERLAEMILADLVEVKDYLMKKCKTN